MATPKGFDSWSESRQREWMRSPAGRAALRSEKKADTAQAKRGLNHEVSRDKFMEKLRAAASSGDKNAIARLRADGVARGFLRAPAPGPRAIHPAHRGPVAHGAGGKKESGWDKWNAKKGKR